MKIKTLTIVGVGLIGGSIGLAAKRRGVAERILGAGRQQASLDRALALGAIDEGFLDLTQAVYRADLAVFCTPVDRIAGQIIAAAPGCRPGTLLTDAGSTKAGIVRDVDGRLPAGVHFVGSHPLAGSEKRGPEHADADLFQDRLTIVTQTPRTDQAALERTSEGSKRPDRCALGEDEGLQLLRAFERRRRGGRAHRCAPSERPQIGARSCRPGRDERQAPINSQAEGRLCMPPPPIV